MLAERILDHHEGELMGTPDVAPQDPTELAAEVSDTQSVQAWGLAEDWGDEPPRGRFTPGRIVTAAVAASLLLVAAAGAVAWQHLRVDETAPTAETSMVQATVAPTTTITVAPKAAPIPVAAPVPPPPRPVPPARSVPVADTYTTYVSWLGSPCLEISFPNGNTMITHTSCAPTQMQDVHHRAGAGLDSVIGADPVIGQATAIACRVVSDTTGAIIASDYGTAGDGHDINCIVPAP